jgi:hypothetical protein
VRTASGAAVVPDPYRLQTCNADDTTSFDNHPVFHSASLDRPPGGDNALFGEDLITAPLRSVKQPGVRDVRVPRIEHGRLSAPRL